MQLRWRPSVFMGMSTSEKAYIIALIQEKIKAEDELRRKK
jgi:hypothetical protein